MFYIKMIIVSIAYYAVVIFILMPEGGGSGIKNLWNPPAQPPPWMAVFPGL
jgi:hypothetical protein